MTCSPQCKPISHKVALPSSSTSVAVSQRNRSSSTTVTVRVQAFNDAGLGSQKISTYRLKLLPNAHHHSADNSSGLIHNKEINMETSSVAVIEDIGTISKAVAAIEDTSTISKDVVSTSKYVTNASVVATDITVNSASITEHEHKEIVFNAASGAIDLGTDTSTETRPSTTSYARYLSSVISAPYSQPTPNHKQQKRYQLLKRSQHMMSFRETPSEQSSTDSAGALQVRMFSDSVNNLYILILNI